jgi:hypothetical protein
MAAYMEEKIVFANYGHFLWRSLNLRVYMFSSNPNSDFKEFFDSVASKLNRYNGISNVSDTNNYIQSYDSYPTWPNLPNRQYLSLLIEKHKNDTGYDFCGDIMSTTYLPESAADPKKMCIFLTSTNPQNPQDKLHRLHSAATVYFSSKFQETGNSAASITFRREKVLNIEAICAAPRDYVRNNGGRKLMTLLIGASKQIANVKAMYLNAINVAGTLNFYKSLGFTETGETDDEGNIEHTLQIGPEFDVLKKVLLAQKAAKQWKKMLPPPKVIEIWSAEHEENLDALGGIFGKTGNFGFGKKTRAKKGKKRKSKVRNSKTRARVS